MELAVRRDSAVHVSLSSDSRVKQPGTYKAVPPSGGRRAVEAWGFRSGSGTWSPNISEELRRHAVAPRRRRAELTFIWLRGAQKSTPDGAENGPARCRPATVIFARNIGSLDEVQRAADAALQPHSSAPLVPGVGGVTFGGNLRRCRAIRDIRRHPTIGQKAEGRGR
jgi:hypothetical protein